VSQYIDLCQHNNLYIVVILNFVFLQTDKKSANLNIISSFKEDSDFRPVQRSGRQKNK